MTKSPYRVIRFQGALAPDQQPALRCAVTIRIHRWDPTSLDVDLLWLGEEEDRLSAARAMRAVVGGGRLLIHSLDPEHPSVELIGISGLNYDQREAKIHVLAIEFGMTDSQLEPGDYQVTARLQPSGMLVAFGGVELNFDGNIKVDRHDGIAIFDTPLGTFEARETYEYFSTHAHGNDVIERIQRATIQGTINPKTEDTFRSWHRDFLRTVDDVCSALSLCYRQPVKCYEIEYMHLGGADSSPALYRRRWALPKRLREYRELIAARNLTDGGLQLLLNALASTTNRDELIRAIQFLAASYEELIEVAYFMAFAAMETTVNACLEDNQKELATKSQWKKLEPALRVAVTTIGESIDLPNEAVVEMKNKIVELKRASLQARVEFARERYGPKTSDIWPDIDFIEGIKRAAAVRNGLFHSADSRRLDEMHESLIRIRIFTERLLLRQLKWPDDQIWTWYDQELKWLNKQPA